MLGKRHLAAVALLFIAMMVLASSHPTVKNALRKTFESMKGTSTYWLYAPPVKDTYREGFITH
jgi:hypothetical protein